MLRLNQNVQRSPYGVFPDGGLKVSISMRSVAFPTSRAVNHTVGVPSGGSCRLAIVCKIPKRYISQISQPLRTGGAYFIRDKRQCEGVYRNRATTPFSNRSFTHADKHMQINTCGQSDH